MLTNTLQNAKRTKLLDCFIGTPRQFKSDVYTSSLILGKREYTKSIEIALSTHTLALLSACNDIPELAASDMIAMFYTT